MSSLRSASLSMVALVLGMLMVSGSNVTLNETDSRVGDLQDEFAVFLVGLLGLAGAAAVEALGPGKCNACIERDYGHSGAISMNFKDVEEESNWNQKGFSAGHRRECVTEKISGSKKIKMVQFFTKRQSDSHCICAVQISCHTSIMHKKDAMVEIGGDVLTKKWKAKWPQGKQTQEACPTKCVLLSESLGGLKGMNVLGDAMSCKNDTACMLKNIEMW